MARRRSYQKGNVQPRRGEWTIRYREFDHVTRKWITRREKLGVFKSKKAALRASKPIMVRVNEQNNSDKPPPRQDCSGMTFMQFVKGRWRAYSVSAKHEPSTVDCYNSLIKNHLLPRFGEHRLDNIKPVDISGFLEDLQSKKVAGNTLQSFYSLLRLMFDLAREYDLIESSPVRPKLHRPETAKCEKPTLQPQQIQALIVGLSEQERVYVLVVATTGIRMNEGLAFRWLDFDEINREITVAHSLYKQRLKSPKTESSKRTLRLHPTICRMLVEHRERSRFQADEDFIFCRPNGQPLNQSTLRTHLYLAMDAAGIPRSKGTHGYHIFRHTAGSLMYARSHDLKLVQSALGHSNISTTSDIYVHLDDNAIAEGTELLGEEILANCDLTVTQSSTMVS